MVFIHKHTYFLLLLLLFIVAEIAVNPLGEFPLNDDWSYTAAVITFDKTGEFNFGGWPAMSLCTHILWGFGFTKVFGLSFFVLRCSSLLSLIIGLVFLNKLLVQITNDKKIAAFACAVLLFNPMVFSLGNTFMTDVNFNTLIILCFYFAFRFFKTQTWLHYFLFVLFSVALVLLRQYGVILPACFVAACFFLPTKKWKHILLGIVALLIVVVSLKLYEQYLSRILPPNSMYKFSGNVNLLSADFWDNFFLALVSRDEMIILHLLVYAMPVALLFLPSLIRAFNIKTHAVVLFITLSVVYLLVSSGKYFSHGNIFANTVVGAETLYESDAAKQVNYVNANFDFVLRFVNIVSSVISLYVLLLGITHIARKKAWKNIFTPELIFILLFVLLYIFMLLITESFFDRYIIPLITCMILVFAYFSKHYSVKWTIALLPLLFWIYVSVLGTKDYFEWNRQRWNAYWYLRREKNISMEEINGGFETTLWHDGINPGWRNYLSLDGYDYLIQFHNQQEGFELLKTYEVKRYLPYKKDKINIFVRQDTTTVKHD
ncbi:MAG: glycosyltransferase family 39 protein [Bacteroidetes bacterium]|nr:glycosyltransferase family 39 protein [Bacteroidota bacterium]